MAAAPAFTPPPGNPRFPLLDSLRGIAAGMIVLCHTSGVSGFSTDNALGAYAARLNMGVTLFFLLSGFLLYRPFIAARLEGRPRIRVRDYARRRVLRIVPAYWVALTLLAIWPGLLGMWDAGEWWRYYAFGQIYWSESTLRGISPAWSLCVEISFYVALPFLAAGLAWLGRGRPARTQVRVELIVLGAVAVACMAFRTYMQVSEGSYILLNTLLAFIDWFAYGMLLAVLSVWWHGREEESRVLGVIARRPWLPWLVFLVPFWFVSTQLDLPRGFFLVYNSWNYMGEHVLYALCCALLLLPAVFGGARGGWPRRLLATPALAWFGLVSYGVFLYHAPLLLELHDAGADGWLPGSGYTSLTLATLAVATACAAASYYLVERPALRFKDRAARGSSSASRSAAARASAGA
ncbi:MAG TPA: acyltransferase [Solirubrobacteraceae bacterium]|jgi:peptidoglycan/LPS O-acetylase OafA/YrhL